MTLFYVYKWHKPFPSCHPKMSAATNYLWRCRTINDQRVHANTLRLSTSVYTTSTCKKEKKKKKRTEQHHFSRGACKKFFQNKVFVTIFSFPCHQLEKKKTTMYELSVIKENWYSLQKISYMLWTLIIASVACTVDMDSLLDLGIATRAIRLPPPLLIIAAAVTENLMRTRQENHVNIFLRADVTFPVMLGFIGPLRDL